MIRPLSQWRGGSWCLREFNCHFIWCHVVISSQEWQLINQSITPFPLTQHSFLIQMLWEHNSNLFFQSEGSDFGTSLCIVHTREKTVRQEFAQPFAFEQEAKGHRCHQSGTVEKQLMWPADQLVGGQPSSSLTWKAGNWLITPILF